MFQNGTNCRSAFARVGEVLQKMQQLGELYDFYGQLDGYLDICPDKWHFVQIYASKEKAKQWFADPVDVMCKYLFDVFLLI